MSELRRTEVELIDRAEWLADKICNGGDYAKEAASVLIDLAKQIEALRSEKARLDWLIEDQAIINCSVGVTDIVYRVEWPSTEEVQNQFYASVNAAIDAAMDARPTCYDCVVGCGNCEVG